MSQQTPPQQGIGQTRRLLLKLLGVGGITGAGALSAGALALAEPAVAATSKPTGVFSYVAAKNVDAVVAFMRAAFGATQTLRLTDSAGAYHATVSVGGGEMYIGREDASKTFLAASTLGGASTFPIIMVASADAAFDRAVAAGATIQQPPTTMPFGRRLACVVDPFGQPWQLNEALTVVPTASATVVPV